MNYPIHGLCALLGVLAVAACGNNSPRFYDPVQRTPVKPCTDA